MADPLEDRPSLPVGVEEHDDADELIGEIPSVAYGEIDSAEDADPDGPLTPVADPLAQELAAYLHALDVLTDSLRKGAAHAAPAIKRLARALDLGPSAATAEPLRKSAIAVASAPESELAETADTLRSVIRHHLEAGRRAAYEQPAGFNVLVVDDDPIQARLLEATLRNADRAVTSVASVGEARELIGREPFDLVVVDRVLDDEDGHELLMTIRSQPSHSNVPVIVLSSYVADDDVSEAYALGADAYFGKDISHKVLAAAVSAHLFRSAQRRQAVLRDPDTGLRTRTVFLEAYEHQAHLSMRRGAPLTLAMISIDRFRRLVDLHGAESGRRIAGAVAEAIRSHTRSSDIVGRWSQDVFSLALPDTDLAGAQTALAKLWDRLAKESVPLREGSVATPTTSGGVAGLWESGGDTDGQVECALRRLSLARAAGRGRVSISDDPTTRSKVPVLLIEDDQLTAELIKHRLEREGFEVVHYEHGADALEAVAGLDVVLAIVDVSMPGANGYEILLRLRATGAYASVPILMMTQGTEAQTSRAFRLGATDVLRKPFAPSELLARVNRLVHV